MRWYGAISSHLYLLGNMRRAAVEGAPQWDGAVTGMIAGARDPNLGTTRLRRRRRARAVAPGSLLAPMAYSLA